MTLYEKAMKDAWCECGHSHTHDWSQGWGWGVCSSPDCPCYDFAHFLFVWSNQGRLWGKMIRNVGLEIFGEFSVEKSLGLGDKTLESEIIVEDALDAEIVDWL